MELAIPPIAVLSLPFEDDSLPVLTELSSVLYAVHIGRSVQLPRTTFLVSGGEEEFYRSHMRSRLRIEFFKREHFMLVKAQLDKRTIPNPQRPEAPVSRILPMSERTELANLFSSVDMRSPDVLDFRVAAVQALAEFCGRAEAAKRSSINREAQRKDLSGRTTVR